MLWIPVDQVDLFGVDVVHRLLVQTLKNNGVSGFESYCTSSVSPSFSSPVILLRSDPRVQTERDNIGSGAGGVEANWTDWGSSLESCCPQLCA
ncbi:hypothetical protein XENOCAPTIV_005690 [Xenoophorus captivus]|uniref:Uncharacterized protein n=1 Tax=Xenoophorus captivus TaxID=1517983 RepID=A0ABV0RFQ6_9TELE